MPRQKGNGSKRRRPDGLAPLTRRAFLKGVGVGAAAAVAASGSPRTATAAFATDAIVVGAGFTGLSAAYELQPPTL